MQPGESYEQYQSRTAQQADAKLAQSVAATTAFPHCPNLDCSNLLKPEKAIVLLNAVISSGLHPLTDALHTHSHTYLPMTDA
jgi:hypothetical protein